MVYPCSKSDANHQWETWYGRGPHAHNHGGVGPQPLHCLQMLISVNIFLEGDKGVKERSLQIDHIPKNDYFYFTKNDYFIGFHLFG